MLEPDIVSVLVPDLVRPPPPWITNELPRELSADELKVIELETVFAPLPLVVFTTQESDSIDTVPTLILEPSVAVKVAPAAVPAPNTALFGVVALIQLPGVLVLVETLDVFHKSPLALPAVEVVQLKAAFVPSPAVALLKSVK